MGVFHQEETPNPSRRCKYLTAYLKDAFSNCRFCGERLAASSPVEEHMASDIDDEEEVVSEIRSRAMEKLRNKPFITSDSFSWIYSPKTGELFVTARAVQQKIAATEEEGEEDGREEFFSVGSCFSCRSSGLTREAFLSAKTNLSRCSSLQEFEFPDFTLQDFRRRSIIKEFCHCEGWPFGLCRKALLLPPLPKSPSESWSWRKGPKNVKN